jgi:transposase
MTSPRKMRYPSDLTDAQWSRLDDVLPPKRLVGRHRSVSLRDVANAINYRWETGCVWRMLPHDFPAWGTVYAYFRTWQRAGVIRQLREILLEPRPKITPGTRRALSSPDRATLGFDDPRRDQTGDRDFPALHGRAPSESAREPRP